jgi:predicted ATP-dependent endonuclease of OLD family
MPKSEEIETHTLYKNKWKRLINNDTLKIFFAKRVLFVEGPVEHNLFNNILREELNHEIERNGIEIIPIFGKLHYAFFVELAEKLRLNYWFLLDYDGKKDPQTGKNKWLTKSNGKISHENFWKEYGEGKDNEDDVYITHSKDTRISWVHPDIEGFLGIPKGDWGAKQENIINESEKIISNLKKEPKKLKALVKIISFF